MSLVPFDLLLINCSLHFKKEALPPHSTQSLVFSYFLFCLPLFFFLFFGFIYLYYSRFYHSFVFIFFSSTLFLFQTLCFSLCFSLHLFSLCIFSFPNDLFHYSSSTSSLQLFLAEQHKSKKMFKKSLFSGEKFKSLFYMQFVHAVAANFSSNTTFRIPVYKLHIYALL